jgi:hypothetical protein
VTFKIDLEKIYDSDLSFSSYRALEKYICGFSAKTKNKLFRRSCGMFLC